MTVTAMRVDLEVSMPLQQDATRPEIFREIVPTSLVARCSTEAPQIWAFLSGPVATAKGLPHRRESRVVSLGTFGSEDDVTAKFPEWLQPMLIDAIRAIRAADRELVTKP